MGGYHSGRDLFEEEASEPFQALLTECVGIVEAHDQSFRGEDGAAATAELREATEAWINISGRESLNLLHHHSDSTWSGVYYLDDGRGGAEGNIGGQLLLRVAAGGGTGACDPDETHHLPRMALRGIFETDLATRDLHEYVEIEPLAGHLILFPGTLI